MIQRPELIEAAQQGDLKALEQLLTHWQPTMRRMAKTQCADGDADDALQESLWLVWRRIGTLRTVTAFPGWIFAIIQRECARLIRSKKHTEPLPHEDHPVFACYGHPELRLDLAAAIHSLPEKYRVVILLRDVEELPIGEIAEQLLLTREAVKSRIHRGRLMIQEYLDD
ncbi:sigma-70 family RNA polymerase sigma factor [Prodigiosinella confusarubida]|uniref:Sigma-70 family RNA polymerase sigma factor n=1 Tax=Serratia sp. (strain ATCC 39006) TaxID=104623 RepID=A0A2I5T2Q1_SERS3|nr:sigma-70 family RNA polymerase sigma factor [Serratia sp. ATCC 39006]AUG98857.1 sigma-70 family RNA polymerase sigma factor [Serratia sp. ATCC 39006]AUH03172.1 sigma-70 family RNA polymerase sigma factor [Serratia sp. ATCC 39006]